jgi:hypothetical protein
MATDTAKRPRRRDDPDRAHAFLVNPPEGRFDYDPMHDLPKCPDPPLDAPWEIASAKLWEGQFREGKVVSQRTRFYPSKGAVEGQVRALRESVPALKRMNYGTMRKVSLRESEGDWWSLGLNSSPRFGSSLSPYIPLLPGPATRQLYWSDYFGMSAKAFEAYQHNPIAHRAVEIHCEFILGRGVEARAKTETGQKVWDAFWQTNNMDNRLEEIVGDCGTYGELFLRYFPQPNRTLAVRSLDPAGIYDIITDQEDWESVYFYHQQEQERSQLFAPPGGNIAPTGPTDPGAVTRYTIRQIPANEVDHYRINARSGEVRGRSDLFPALGYLKRLTDLLTSRVIRADMEARMVFDLMVKGNAGDVTATRNQLFPGGKPPDPGAVLGHNEQVELEAFQFDSAAQADDGSVDELVSMCSLGVGVAKEYLWQGGKSGGGARANALVATEPGQKRFERRQRLTQRILADMAARVFAVAGLTGDDTEIEFVFPSIAVEERSAALKDTAFAESQGWISKKTAATMAARSMDIETFDFEGEQQLIAEEFEHTEDDEPDTDAQPVLGPDGAPISSKPPTKPKQGDGVIRRPMMNATYRQAPKLDPTKASSAEDQPPGLLMPGAGGAEGAAEAGPPGVATDPRAPGRSGFPGDENPTSSAGAANIRKDNLRESDRVIRVAEVAIREAYRAAARVPRRRPDDPSFQALAGEYRDESDRHARELIASIHPAASE